MRKPGLWGWNAGLTEDGRTQSRIREDEIRNLKNDVAIRLQRQRAIGVTATGLNANTGGTYSSISFRRTDKDRAPPKSIVTAKLMGDPPPGRSALAQRDK